MFFEVRQSVELFFCNPNEFFTIPPFGIPIALLAQVVDIHFTIIDENMIAILTFDGVQVPRFSNLFTRHYFSENYILNNFNEVKQTMAIDSQALAYLAYSILPSSKSICKMDKACELMNINHLIKNQNRFHGIIRVEKLFSAFENWPLQIVVGNPKQ